MTSAAATPLDTAALMQRRAVELYHAHHGSVTKWTDCVFGSLMIVQWAVCVALALWVSPGTWIGALEQANIHVIGAVLFGGALAAIPVYMATRHAGKPVTRHVLAIAQMLYGLLLIDLTGGRIETHFHVFGSLALLAFYRDWRVLVTASAIVTVDHLVRGSLWPQAVFGAAEASPWRWIEHVGWIVFIDIFLVASCVRSEREMRMMAFRQAQVEVTKEHIEDIVIERTRQVEQAKQDAEAANRAKSEFLANMSHELRTPMTAILGYSELLQDPELAASQKLECIQTIRRNGQHLIGIVNDILDISKIEAGRMTVELRRTSLVELVSELASSMRMRAGDKGLSFTVEYRGPVPSTIETDAVRLRQILLNLLANAIKFTQVGGVTMTVQLVKPQDGEPQLRFDVRDTGIGVSDQQRAKLFQPFSQADEGVTRKFGGTGLGLAISRKLAQLLGGDVTLESEPGRGSIFSAMVATGDLTGVPMLAKPTELEGSHHVLLPPQHEAMPALNARILLAEDGIDNQRLLRHFLHSAGAEVIVVENGKLACEEAMNAQRSGRPFDLIFMDMQMPEMDGYTATRTLREQGYRAPIVALTAHAISGDRERCLHAGCDDYLSKPVSRSVLLQTARRYTAPGDDQSLKFGAAGSAMQPRRAPHERERAATGDGAITPLYSEFSHESDMLELIDCFLAELPERLREIEAAESERNLAVLASLAHKLKGAAGGYGYGPITEAARTLEQRARAHDAAAVHHAAVELKQLCIRACAGRTTGRAA